MRHGADIHAMDEVTGRDILSWACFLDRTSEVATLMRITHGDLPLTVRDHLGFTPLHYAAITGNREVTRMLCEVMVRHRLPVDIVDAQAVTPYIHAKRRHLPQVADILVSVGGASPHQFDPVLFTKPAAPPSQAATLTTPRARSASPPRSVCSEPTLSRSPRLRRPVKRPVSTVTASNPEVIIADEIASIKLTDDKKCQSARGWRPSQVRRDSRIPPRPQTTVPTFPFQSLRDPPELPTLSGSDCHDAVQKILDMRSMEMTSSYRKSAPGPEESALGLHALASIMLRFKMKGARLRKQSSMAPKTPRNTGSRASTRFTFADGGKGGGGLLAALRSKGKVN